MVENEKHIESMVDFYETLDRGHGREEHRRYYAFGYIDSFEYTQSVAMVESNRLAEGKLTTERYYISSLPPVAKDIAVAIRNHWSVENNLQLIEFSN